MLTLEVSKLLYCDIVVSIIALWRAGCMPSLKKKNVQKKKKHEAKIGK